MTYDDQFEPQREVSDLCPIDVRINKFSWLNLAIHSDEFDDERRDRHWVIEALGIYS